MKVTGSIVTYNNIRTIEKCIQSIIEETEGKAYDFKLYIYDNSSTDGTVELIESKFPQVKLIKGEDNRGFGYGHNYIIKRVKSDHHFVINPDIVMDSDVIGELSSYMEKDSSVGLITPKVLNPDGTEQYLPKFGPSIKYSFIGNLPGMKGIRRQYTRQDEEFTGPTEIRFCTGCFFGVRTSFIKELKGFSNRYFMYCEDSDLSRRVLNEGKSIIFYPDEHIYHHWKRDNTHNIKGFLRFVNSLIKYFNKWGWEF